QENWLNVFLMGEKIGYYHETKQETIFNKEPVYEINSEMISKLVRFGIEFNIRQVSQVYLAKDYSARFCRYQEEMFGSQKIVSATVQGNKLFVEINLNGEITKQTLDWNTSSYFDAAVTEKIIHDGLISGKQYQFKVYSPELARWFEMSASVGTTERIELNGVTKEAVVVKSDYTLTPELSSVTWISKADQQVVKAELGNYGMQMVQVPEAEAKEFKQKMEIKNLASIASNITFTEPSEVTKMRVNITYREGNPGSLIPEDSRQKWENSADTTAHSRILVITANSIDESTAPELPFKIKDEKITRFLSSTPYIQSDDTAIVATAKRIAGNEKNSAKVAVALCNWVNSYVENKGFDTGFASAKDTFRTKRGDCTEHSVLLAALTRAVGVPTKIATGITYAEDGFYYHMWVEVYLGKWVPLDPTMGETRVNATHIKLAETETREDELSDYALKLLRSLKKFQLEVLDYDMAGEHYTAEDSPNLNLNERYKAIEKMLNE
ncbi:MAG: transglutaminase-like domain-containing protein, partial [bacterium]|nr:transglutaminase-like domain-containing protein [bacterium]